MAHEHGRGDLLLPVLSNTIKVHGDDVAHWT